VVSGKKSLVDERQSMAGKNQEVRSEKLKVKNGGEGIKYK